MEEDIRNQIPDVEIHYFPWTGRNRATDRLTAARELRAHLRALRDLQPQADHFAVAHSHGGNVLLHALAEPNDQRRLSGVVFLATPFLDAQPRDVTKASLRALNVSLAFWIVLAATILLNTFGVANGASHPALLSVAMLATVALLELRGPDPIRRRAAQVCALVRQPSVADARVLILRSPLDEPGLAYSLAQALQYVTTLWNGLSRRIDDVGNLIFYGLGLSMLIMFVIQMGTIFYAVLQGGAPSTVEPSRLLFYPLSAAMFFLILLMLSLVPIMVLTWLVVRPYGVVPSIRVAFFIRVIVEPLPVGDSSVYQLDWVNQSRGLAHSLSHSDPRATKRVARWLRSSMLTAEGEAAKGAW